jgi:hypothetical protein
MMEHMTEKVFEIYMRTTPERLWEAITDPELRSMYHFGSRIESDVTPGSRFEMVHVGPRDVAGDGPAPHVAWLADVRPRDGRSRSFRRARRRAVREFVHGPRRRHAQAAGECCTSADGSANRPATP